MRKDEAINRMNNANLSKIVYHLKIYIYISISFFIDSNNTYYERQKGNIAKTSKKLLPLRRGKERKTYYEHNKQKLQEQSRNKYRELTNKEEFIKREYGSNRYRNISKYAKEYIYRIILYYI